MAQTRDAEREPAVRRWFRDLPRTWQRAVVAGLLAGWLVLWYVGLLVVNAWLDGDEPAWTAPLPGMLGGLAGVGGVLWLQRRRMGSFRQVGEYERALRRR